VGSGVVSANPLATGRVLDDGIMWGVLGACFFLMSSRVVLVANWMEKGDEGMGPVVALLAAVAEVVGGASATMGLGGGGGGGRARGADLARLLLAIVEDGNSNLRLTATVGGFLGGPGVVAFTGNSAGKSG
jgi:hypothetical protein